MKNTIRILSILSLMLVITLASCGGGGSPNGDGIKDQDKDGGGDGSISGNTITAKVLYDIKNFINESDMEEAKKATDFSFSCGYPLSHFINRPASITVSKGIVTIKLGTLKDEYCWDENDWEIEGINEGVTVIPKDARGNFLDDDFSKITTSDEKYFLTCEKDNNSVAILIYADKAVTIKGTYTGYVRTTKFDVSLKAGWNYCFSSWNEATKTETLTASTTLPSGYKWAVSGRLW